MAIPLGGGDSLQVTVGAATTTNAVVVDGSCFMNGNRVLANTTISTTTAASIFTASPSGGSVAGLNIYMPDTVSQTITVARLTSGGTTVPLFKFQLQTGDTWRMDDSGRIFVLDNNGNIKQSAGH